MRSGCVNIALAKETWSNHGKMRSYVIAFISNILCVGLHVRRIKKALNAPIWLMLLSVAALYGIFGLVNAMHQREYVTLIFQKIIFVRVI